MPGFSFAKLWIFQKKASAWMLILFCYSCSGLSGTPVAAHKKVPSLFVPLDKGEGMQTKQTSFLTKGIYKLSVYGLYGDIYIAALGRGTARNGAGGRGDGGAACIGLVAVFHKQTDLTEYFRRT